jgi:hypothetical protein
MILVTDFVKWVTVGKLGHGRGLQTACRASSISTLSDTRSLGPICEHYDTFLTHLYVLSTPQTHFQTPPRFSVQVEPWGGFTFESYHVMFESKSNLPTFTALLSLQVLDTITKVSVPRIQICLFYVDSELQQFLKEYKKKRIGSGRTHDLHSNTFGTRRQEFWTSKRYVITPT